jgi:hypothetical protein
MGRKQTGTAKVRKVESGHCAEGRSGLWKDMLRFALAVRFSLEICLVAVALWFPWHHSTGATAIVGSVALAVVLVLTWGTFLSPKRRVEIGGSARQLLETALFGLAAAGLYSEGHWQLAATLIGIALIDKLVLVAVEGRA